MARTNHRVIIAVALSAVMILSAGCMGWGGDETSNPVEETDGNGEVQADEDSEDHDQEEEDVDETGDAEADAADKNEEEDVTDPPEEDTEVDDPESEESNEMDETTDETSDKEETETDEEDEESFESDEEDETDPSDDGDADEEPSESDEEDEANNDEEELSENRIEIEYTGPWEATVSESGSQRIVEGSGSDVIELDAGVNNPWATVTKQDNSQDRLTVRLIIGGEVVDEEYDETEIGVVGVDHIGSLTGVEAQKLQVA